MTEACTGNELTHSLIDPDGTFRVPAELDRAIELARAAYVEAMREYGMFLGTVLAISANAELKIAEVLSRELAEDGGPTVDTEAT